MDERKDPAGWQLPGGSDLEALSARGQSKTALRPSCSAAAAEPASKAWDAATSASSVASVVGSGVAVSAWSSTRTMVSGRGVARGRASTSLGAL